MAIKRGRLGGELSNIDSHTGYEQNPQSPDDLAAAFESACARLQLLVLETCEGAEPWPQRAAAEIRAALEFAAADPAAARALTVDAWAQGASGIARHQRLIEHFAKLLTACRAERPVDAAPLPEITERPLVGGLARLIAERLDHDLLTAKGAVLRKQAARNAPSPADAEEALQDGCVEFLLYYDGPPGLPALCWPMLAVKHRGWEIARRAAKAQEAGLELTTTDVLDVGESRLIALCDRPGPSERAERGEEVAAFFAALGRLGPDQRTALMLLGLGYTYRQIMHRQGWSYTKVNRCLSEGRAALRALTSG